METYDPRVDAYILKSQDFAIPILDFLRKLIHKLCPECTETIKWGFPHFVYKNEILCFMASFKNHCAFGFWKEKILIQSSGLSPDKGKTAMGDFGKISSLKDLPTQKVLSSLIKDAMKLNEEGTKIKKIISKIKSQDIVVPEMFQKALNKNLKSKKVFEALSNSHKKEYIEYITEAKREETKHIRILKSIEKLIEGKSHNYKYNRAKKG